jgi:hypothetical protein
LYASPSIIRVIKLRRIAWGTRSLYKILVEKPEGKRLLGRSRRRWEDNRMDLKEINWESVDWIHRAQDGNQWRAPVNTAMNLLVP